MDATGGLYPRYDREFEIRNGLWMRREDVDGSHVRLYLPDFSGRLRLIFINDGSNDEYWAIDQAILENEFGVRYDDLSLGKLDKYTKVADLDDRNAFPAAFYPPGARRKKPPADMALPQVDALQRLNEIIPASQTDAWL